MAHAARHMDLFKGDRRMRDWLLGLVAVLAFVGAAWAYQRRETPRPRRMILTAGSEHGSRHHFGRVLAREALTKGILLTIEPSAGSEIALEQVQDGKVDLAMVQGALDFSSYPDVRQVATLHVEALHLLVKSNLIEETTRALTNLEGHSINIGASGSGTHLLAQEVLAYAGLTPSDQKGPEEYIADTLTYDALLNETDTSRLPDAVFTVSSLPSPIARHLVRRHGYGVVPLEFGPAMSLDGTLEPPDGPVQAGVHAVRKQFLHETLLPPYAYNVVPAVPSEALRTIGTRLLLVANKKTSPEAIQRLIGAVYAANVHMASPPVGPEALELPPELPWHEGTLRYMESRRPIIASDVLNVAEQGVSIGAPILGGLLCGLGWMGRRVRRRMVRGFDRYIDQVAEVEREGLELEVAPQLDLAALLSLRRRLSVLKSEALDQFAKGTLEGDELLASFLLQVNDVRHYLSSLVLHERNNLEDRAVLEQSVAAEVQHRVEQLWKDVQTEKHAGPAPS